MNIVILILGIGLFVLCIIGIIVKISRYRWCMSQHEYLAKQCYLYTLDKLRKGEEVDTREEVYDSLGIWDMDKMLKAVHIKDFAAMSDKPEWTRLIMNYEPDQETIQLAQAGKKLVEEVGKTIARMISKRN
jgi:hypothetical protein